MADTAARAMTTATVTRKQKPSLSYRSQAKELQARIDELEKENRTLKEERQANREVIVFLSRAVRSLQFRLNGGGASPRDIDAKTKSMERDGIRLVEESRIIPAEERRMAELQRVRARLSRNVSTLKKGVDLLAKKNGDREVKSAIALKNMMNQIGMLQDERRFFIDRLRRQEDENKELETQLEEERAENRELRAKVARSADTQSRRPKSAAETPVKSFLQSYIQYVDKRNDDDSGNDASSVGSRTSATSSTATPASDLSTSRHRNASEQR